MRLVWRSLQVERRYASIPPLLVKTEFGLSNYKVWLTDLTHIWTESRDRRQIIQRALSVDTSIDPSEDFSQLRFFLQSIEDALGQRAGTTLNVVQGDSEKQLILQTSTTLPGPLKPLEWRVLLVPAPQAVFTTEFVIPLLSQLSAAKAEKASLLQQLRLKDNVIGKLIERMQSDGVDLIKAFPGAPHARPGANARQVIAKSVKGLGEFDFDQWQTRMARDLKSLEELKDLISDAFDAEPAETPGESQIQESPHYGDWWSNLKRDNSHQTPATSLLPTSDAEGNGAVEGDFQTQLATPKLQEKLASNKGKGLDLQANDPSLSPEERLQEISSTTDDSDADVQPSKSTEVSPQAVTRLQNHRPSARETAQIPPTQEIEGADRGNRAALQNRDPSSKAKDISDIHDASSNSNGTAINLDKDTVTSCKAAAHNKMADQVHTTPKPKSKLGKIGGKGNVGKASDLQVVANQKDPTRSVERQANGKTSGKGRIETKPSLGVPEQGTISGATVQPQASSPPQENSQERANKKREELKRELENKSHIGAKKKRKF